MAPDATQNPRGTSPPTDPARGVDVSTIRDIAGLLAQRATGNRLGTGPIATPVPAASPGLARTIGNRRVSWADSAAPESAPRAHAMDQLEVLRDEELTRLRGEAATLAIAPFGREQQAALRKLEDIEFVTLARGIEPTKEVRQQDSSRPHAKQRRLNVRVLIEQGIRLEGSFEKAIAAHEGWAEIKSDIQYFRDEARRFETQFRSHAVMTALRMLTESQRGIERILRSYGLPNGAVVEAANRLAKGSDLDTEVARVLQIAVASEHIDDDAFKKKRVSLVNRARRLLARQEAIRQKETSYGAMYGGATHGGYVGGPDRIEFSEAWVAAVRAHPVLTAFRRSGEGEYVVVDLRRLTTGPIEDVMKALLSELIPKLRDIRQARNLLTKGPKALDPLSLPPVVALTRKNMFIPEGSLRDGVARDIAAKAARRADPRWLTLASFVLAIVTFIPTGGMSVGIPIGAASLVLAAYSAAQEWEQYGSRGALSNTDIDIARSLWTKDPSLTWFVVSLVLAGFELVPLVREFRKARRVSRLAAGEETADALFRKAAREAPRVPSPDPNKLGHAASHAKAEDLEKALAKAFSAAKVEHGSNVAELNPMMRDLMAGLEYKGRPMTIYDLSSKLDLKLVRAIDGTPLNEAARQVVGQLPTVYKALRDPEFVQRVAAEVWTYAAKQKPPITTREALEQMLGGRVREVVIKDDPPLHRWFREVIQGDGPWVDLKLANDPHGAYTHMFQELVVQRALAARGKGAGRPFRQLIAQAEGPMIFSTKAGEKKPFWSAVWDSLFDDLYGKGPLYRTEDMGDLLQRELGLPNWVPAKMRKATSAR